MGHYDTSFESDDKVRLTEKQIAAQRMKNSLDALRHNLHGTIKVPPRFTGALEDFDNWLKQTYKVE